MPSAAPCVDEENRVRRKVYITLPNGGVVSLYRIARTSNGLYVVGMSARAGAGQHLSYHESGICFDHSTGERTRAKRRPLSGYTGDASILLSHVVAHRVDPRAAVGPDEVRPGDIVLDRPGDIGVEMILSDSLDALPRRADRPNAELHRVPMIPRLLIEIFDVTGGLGSERYPDAATWEGPHLLQAGGHGGIEHVAIPIYRLENPEAKERLDGPRAEPNWRARLRR
jgi:hypothetical protein